MSALVTCTQEVPQALKNLQIDLSTERLLSGERRAPPSLEVDVSSEEGCLGLPRLAVCRSPSMEWRPLEATCSNNSSPLEQPDNFAVVDHSQSHHDGQLCQSHPTPLCSSTPDIRQTAVCINEQLSNQRTQTQSLTHTHSKHQRSLTHSNSGRLLSRSQTTLNRTRSKSLTDQTGSPVHKRMICDFEKDLTFRPRLNDYSLKLVSQSTRKTVPLMNRLLEAKKSVADPYDERLTFAPKLNPTSLKMAQERAAKMPEVQARIAEQATARRAEVLSEYTFKPRVSVRSLKIAQSLGTSFQSRQKMYLERRQKALDEAYKTPPITKRQVKLNHRVPPLPHNTSKDTPKKPTDSPAKQDHTHSNTTSSPIIKTPKSSSTTTPESLSRQNSDSSSQSLQSKPKGGRRGKSEEVKSPPAEEVGRVTLSGPKFSSMSNGDRVRRVKVRSERIIRAKKVFLIMDGYRLIRQGLRRRGWVEQDYHKATTTSSPKKTMVKSEESLASDDSDCGDDLCEDEEVYSDEEEYSMMSRAVRNAVPNFVWSLKRYGHIYRNLNKDSLVNHFAKASSFTTKVGLCSNLRNLVWYGDTDPNTFFPRCYKLSCDEEKEAFVDDYRLTSALCILKMVSTQFTTQGEGETLSLSVDEPAAPSSPRRPSTASTPPARSPTLPPPAGPRPVLSVEGLALATRAIKFFISSKQHEDIEGSQTHLHRQLSVEEWTLLIKYFYKMVFERAVIKVSDCMAISEANSLLDEAEEYCPQMYMDGSRNVWIVKPGAMSRGRGIICMNNLEDILSLVSSTVVKKEGRWVVQKYIERPLLIYDTKFDVRQWFLVTDWNPLTMWIYKDCYMRFCTQTYTLDDLDESVHLCNNSVQRNYANSASRATALPPDNMWDSATFKDYLESIDEGDKWEGVVYPGMKQALVHVLQVTQDEIEHRKCSFELYGADFMISSDYRPWLIEVNSSPSMSLSTAVTARLCRAVLKDTLKVVVDRRDDKDCDTGGFELAYKQVRLDQPTYVGMQLCVHGSTIPRPRETTFIHKTTSPTSHKSLSHKYTSVKSDTNHTPPHHHPPQEDVHTPYRDSIATPTEGVFDTTRVTTPHITNCSLDCEPPPTKPRTPVKSARRRVVPRARPSVTSSPTLDPGLVVAAPRFGESIPNRLTTGEGMAISASTGNVNPVARATWKPSPDR